MEFANRWLDHLNARRFSPATVRGYAFDVLCLARFFEEVGLDWREANPTDFFDWLDWQGRPGRSRGKRVVRIETGRGAAAATMNRRIAAARGLFDHAVMCNVLDRNPVPAPRRRLSDCEGHGRDCSAMSAAGGRARPPVWCDRNAVCLMRGWMSRTFRCSLPIWPRIEIGRWCWRCC